MTDIVTPRSAPITLATVRSRGGLLSRGSLLRRLDYVLLFAALGLSSLGALLIWSATKPLALASGADPQGYLKRHLLNLTIGLLLGAALAAVDYRALRAYAPIIYGLSLLGELAVLSPLGSTIKGAHSWIVIGGGFQVQPSEFTKVALVLTMAMLLGEKRDGESDPRDVDVLQALGLAAVPMVLVLAQPDLGMVLVFVFLTLGMIAASGAPSRWVAGLVTAGVLFGGAIVHYHLLKPYQEARLTSFAHPGAHSSSIGYNQQQAVTAIGAGGLLGEGPFHGTQTNGHFVPEQQTDFVFTVAGEELGFAGAGGLLLLLGLLLWRALRIAATAGDSFGTLVAVGVASWFAFQGFINVGMTLGIMPVTGLPLMFVSYGGSSMFANWMAIGLLQNVHARSRA